MDKVDRLIEIVRLLKEEGMGVSTLGPTNKVGSGEQSLGYNIQTGTPPVDLRRSGARNWNPFFKDLARVLRRTDKKKKRKSKKK
jgi:hypothetical protein